MKKHLTFALCFGLALSLNIYFRAFPINFPQLKIEARNTVIGSIRQGLAKEINAKFPEMGNLAKDRLIENSVSGYLKKNKQAIENRARQKHLKLKNRYQDGGGQTYLMELDCWHWARYVDNVCRLGHPGDKVVNGRQMDTLMLAPSGSYLPWNQFLFYSSAWLYNNFFLIFGPLPLSSFLFYLPLFFVAIFIGILYLFCFWGGGNLSAFLTCIFVGLSRVFLLRSHAGWFDMDVLNLLMPLLICWTYILAYSASSFRPRLLWLCLSAFWLGIFSFTWVNWWFILLVILAYEIFSLLQIPFLFHRKKGDGLVIIRQRLFSLFLFLGFSLCWVLLFSGIEPLRAFYSQLQSALVLNKPLTMASAWPNVFSTVDELRELNIIQMAGYIAPLPLTICSFICMLALFLRTLHNPEYVGFERERITILFFWFIGMLFACFRGIRFTMFLLVPLGVSLGLAAEEAIRYFRNKKRVISFAIIILIISFTLQFLKIADETARGIFPLMNGAWYKTLTGINQKAPKEAVVNSWWDFGDWFKAVSQRAVIFDGQSQDTPQAYWMANALISADEREAIGILRMLNNGGNKAFEIINQRLKNSFASVLLLKKIILCEPKEARETLSKFLPPQEIEEVMKLVFNKPVKAYFVVDYTMPQKIPAISFLGNWDFTKVYLSQNLKDKEKALDYLVSLGQDKQKLKKLYEEAELIPQEKLHNWVSHRVRFYGGLCKGQERDNAVLFDNGLVYHPKEKAVYLYASEKGSYKIPGSLFLFDGGKIEDTKYTNSDSDYSVLIFKTEDVYRSVILDSELAKSVFVRLYFLDGGGLTHFKPLFEEKYGDGYIRVFEIVWS
jgi:dolichyl-diphosphooligosaccharide--protein glycosyltransferase